jgi:hypothetical protein
LKEPVIFCWFHKIMAQREFSGPDRLCKFCADYNGGGNRVARLGLATGFFA